MAKASTHTRNKTGAASVPSEEALPVAAGSVAAGEPSSPTHAAGEMSIEAAPARRITKLGQVRALLASPGGASLAALCAATGWQSHSVRAALTGLRKAGETVEKGKAEDGTTVYRLTAAAEGSK